MPPYTIDRRSNHRRREIEEWLFGLYQVSAGLRDDIVTAWVGAWSSNPYAALADKPFGAGVDYPLMQHMNELTRGGLDLARRAAADWDMRLDLEILLPILILHEVDKPLMYVREAGVTRHSVLYQELPHGVLGAMPLKEPDFAHRIVSTVALHAGNAPYHGSTLEAYVLHYADYFSADHAMIQTGNKPFYQKQVGWFERRHDLQGGAPSGTGGRGLFWQTGSDPHQVVSSPGSIAPLCPPNHPPTYPRFAVCLSSAWATIR